MPQIQGYNQFCNIPQQYPMNFPMNYPPNYMNNYNNINGCWVPNNGYMGNHMGMPQKNWRKMPRNMQIVHPNYMIMNPNFN